MKKHLKAQKPEKAPGYIEGKFYRRISGWMSKRVVKHTNITANQITVLHFSTILLTALLLAYGTYPALLLAAFLLQFGFIIDLVDGEVARARHAATEYGRYLDDALDHIGYPLFIIGIAIGLYRHNPDPLIWILCTVALYARMQSYRVGTPWYSEREVYKKAHKSFASQLGKFQKVAKVFYYTAEFHLGVITLFALLNRLIFALWFIAIYVNLYWIAYNILQWRVVKRTVHGK